ncbi:hypothetical protein [Streptomyces sp. NRRL F-5123]|uniref:hypothetical protein n=1 Tax=Streptomyces sp. NRRL F-5123 TaxID=1463856 RepID=UPI0006949B9C|nr:hypothetical protein [Streptomyces sp. NRRL F-5123]
MDIAIGCTCAWLVRTARRAAGQPDADGDREADARMRHLHELVAGALGEDSALRLAGEEAAAGAGEISERTRRRLADALDEAVEHDAALAAALRSAVAALQSGPSGGGGGADVRAEGGAVAALRMGRVRMGLPAGGERAANPPLPGSPQG